MQPTMRLPIDLQPQNSKQNIIHDKKNALQIVIILLLFFPKDM